MNIKRKKLFLFSLCFILFIFLVGCKKDNSDLRTQNVSVSENSILESIQEKQVEESSSLVPICNIDEIGDKNAEEEMSQSLFYEEIVASYVETVSDKNGWLSWTPDQTKSDIVVNDDSNRYSYTLLHGKNDMLALISVGYLGKYENNYLYLACVCDYDTKTVSYYEIELLKNPDGSYATKTNGEVSSDNEKVKKATGPSTNFFGKNGFEELCKFLTD